MPIPDPWFVHELAVLDKDLFVAWHPKLNRWQIRLWILPHRKGDERLYYIWKRRSMPSRTICYRDGEYYDIGYHPLDQRVLYALKLSMKLSLNPEQTARMVDESNKKLEDEWADNNKDIAREVAKSIWTHYQEPSIDLGQRSAR